MQSSLLIYLLACMLALTVSQANICNLILRILCKSAIAAKQIEWQRASFLLFVHTIHVASHN